MKQIENKECFILGTRPDVIKMAPLIYKIKPLIINTGQHKELADEALDIFKIKPHYNLELMKYNHDVISLISRGMHELNKIISIIEPKRIWVLGDTTTALIGAYVAYLNKIELVHVEAGLRSHDMNNPYPEEMFRTQIDMLSDILFAPTANAVKNLKREKVKGKIYKVGNTIVDALEMIKPSLSGVSPLNEKYVLFTMHRRESFDKDINTVFSIIKQLSSKIKIVFPAHLNPKVQEAVKKYQLETIKPLNYVDFLWYLKHCEYVMSDSGGIQEEVPSFNKPILILRKTTERQEILNSGLAYLTSLEEEDILNKIDIISNLSKEEYVRNPFGNGDSAQKIVNIINEIHK
ncbi:UDP-N-acetylglucosamine 2-epimerase (non-hydrolyzing) [bacterium]|nr:UDP-N-acetylglucosamine 2-epimerase (non-hydrolyzing) [bacterium]